MPITTRAMARRQQPQSDDVQFKYFLDLPLEIRTEIYSYLQACPETRHSLMAVSHQISEECTPLFFRQLRFTIHALYPSALQAGFSKSAIRFSPRCTPRGFDQFYLRKMSDFRLRNIHSLGYNVARPTERRARVSTANWLGMKELCGVLLSHIGSLECLEELVIYMKPRWAITQKEVKIDKEEMWYVVDRDGTWDEIEQKLVRRGGPLQGWKVSRRIELSDVPQRDPSVGHLLRYVSSTFRKTNDNHTTGESLPVPTIVVQIVS